MNTLHYYPGNASMAPHLLLREIGAPFTLQLVDRTQGAHKSLAYLKLNPNGLIPVWVEPNSSGDSLVLYETAAICLYLVDRHPAAGLAPALGSAERAHFYKWLMWLTNTLQATLILYFYPDRWVDTGQSAAAEQVRAHAQAKVAQCLEQIDAQLAKMGATAASASTANPGPWLLGAQYSAVDAYTFMVCRWTRGFSDRPARGYPHIGPYLQRILLRPATQAMLAAEGLSAPWV